MTPALRHAFAEQGAACANLGSPFMQRLLSVLLDSIDPQSALGQRLIAWPEDRLTASYDAVALRLCGGLHAQKLLGDQTLIAAYPPHAVPDAALISALRDVCAAQEAHLLDWMNLPPQTNEVRRAAVLIAAGHWLTARYGKMLILSEIGASAGLNLNWDFFHLQVGDQSFGPPRSPVQLAPEWRGTAPVHCPAYVHEAKGVDLHPLDPNSASDALRLLAYLWPDQPDRLNRTKAAIDLAGSPDTESDAQMTQADALEWLPHRLPHRAPYLHLVYSTVAWQYLPAEAQAKGTALIEAAGASATPDTPLAWFQMETDGQTPGAGLTLRLWPENVTIPMGRADFHGRWVDWHAPNPRCGL